MDSGFILLECKWIRDHFYQKRVTRISPKINPISIIYIDFGLNENCLNMRLLLEFHKILTDFFDSSEIREQNTNEIFGG